MTAQQEREAISREIVDFMSGQVAIWLRRRAYGNCMVRGKTPGAAWENALLSAADALENGELLARNLTHQESKS